MTILEALRSADTGGPYYRGIRRRSWLEGLRIWYSRESLHWWCVSDDVAHALCDSPTQQCLTPETILADDWEVVV